MENTLTPVYMPFTYLSEPTARLLTALVGPMVIYQPLESSIHASLSALESQGLVEIRTPIALDDDRLRDALVEFTGWARMNPGKTTQGKGFLSQRQGEIPFFDETVINRIRSDINRYRQPDPLTDHAAKAREAEFSARLFLALAQENDLATESLDHDLNRFKALEKDFIDNLKSADGVGFNRQAFGAGTWREDPGAKLTGQRIRAWATLAAADAVLPELLVTTSRMVIDTLLETCGEALHLEQLGDIRLPFPPAAATPVLGQMLVDLASRESLVLVERPPFASPAADKASSPAASVTLIGAANRTPARVIRRMAPETATPPGENEKPASVRHTLIVLVESGC
jgi:hypothetical protein